MHVINADLLDHPQGTVKFILNDRGIYFFPATQQHRDSKVQGLSYEAVSYTHLTLPTILRV